MKDRPSTAEEHSQFESRTSPSIAPVDGIQTPDISEPFPTCVEQDRFEEEIPKVGDQSQHVSASASAMQGKSNEVVITNIRATHLCRALRRLPFGFYTIVHHSGLEWRTVNKRSPVDQDVVEWNCLIPIPSDESATVCIGVYASFEFDPVLGAGEQLRNITATVEQLLDYSEKDAPFSFLPMDGEIVSPCSSIMVTVKKRMGESSDSSEPTLLDPPCSAAESQGELENATNQGHNNLSRYRKHEEKHDLERSIEAFERALSICPLDYPCRTAALSNLAKAKFTLCKAEYADSLEVPLGLYRDALAGRLVGHVDRPSTLVHLAEVHLAKFEKQRDEVEGAMAEVLLCEAIGLSFPEAHEHRAATLMLQLLAARRMSPVGQSALEDPTSGFTNEDLRILCGIELLERFEDSGNPEDLQLAIAILELSVRYTALSDDRYRAGIADLGVALLHRFNHFGELRDLDGAISMFRDAVDITTHGRPEKPSHLVNLGSCFFSRYERLGELSDLEHAISMFRNSVNLAPHALMPTSLNGLGRSLMSRFEWLGELSNLQDAISSLEDAVAFTPHDDSQLSVCLNNLGSCFFTRFEHSGELSDLANAILKYRDAIDLAPRGHPHRPACLNNLGGCFMARFERVGELSDLTEAIATLRDTVGLTHDGHRDKPGRLSNLGSCIFARFERLGKLSDLDEAISRYREAVHLTPHGHPLRPTCLNDLGGSLSARFKRTGKLRDLENAVVVLREAVVLTPHGHGDKPPRLNNLGNSLRARFECLGELTDLESAISSYRDAAGLIPQGHPEKPVYLNNLGTSLRDRFERLGELSNLEDAISGHRNAVDLIPGGHLQKARYVNNLGISLFVRFARLGELSDLENAVSSHRDAVNLTPDDNPSMPTHLDGLGCSLLSRFVRLGQLNDLEDAIAKHRKAADLTPQEHINKPSRFNNLGISLLRRFERLGEPSDLQDAISTFKNAIALTPPGRSMMPTLLNNLGTALIAQFQRFGGPQDLENAIVKLKNAVVLTPHGHPHESRHLSTLGASYVIRFDHLGDRSDLEQAISLYSRAASGPVGSVSDRFSASQRWISCARHNHHSSLLHAYSVSISLLPQIAWIGLSLTQRYDKLMQAPDVVREAAATALDSGLPKTAVEWLEQGRSVVWGELFQLRSSCEELSSAYPDHALRLRDLSAALEHAGAALERSLFALSAESEEAHGTAHRATESSEQEAVRHRMLATERDKLLREIRSLPGFGRFLLHKEFSELRASAHSGPVVILNAAESRCDGLIIVADRDHVIHVPLLNFTLKQCINLQNTMKGFVRHAREGRIEPQDGMSWESFLSPLWKCVVKPVLDALPLPTAGELSRVFWCPTGPFVFLPIHSAGFYDTSCSETGHKVYDIVVSSYVPALSVLLLPSLETETSGNLRFLTVRQPPSDGLSQLPGVAIELEHIRGVVGKSPSAHTTLVESSDGTVEEVFDLMKEADWVHFACHGIQDGPDSGLCLAKQRRMKLRDIIALSRPRGGLAFLSACQTATGERRLSDEAIHMAAGMLFAGYGGVIGTMWSINDRLAPDVARDVYEYLFRKSTRPDYREAARALHEAVRDLRDRGVSFAEWVPFIHVGL